MPGGNNDSAWKMLGEFTGLALTLPAAGLIGYAIGYGIDHHFHTGHVFTIVFLLFGAAAGLLEVVRVAGRK